jgi:hypothetical protein
MIRGRFEANAAGNGILPSLQEWLFVHYSQGLTRTPKSSVVLID